MNHIVIAALAFTLAASTAHAQTELQTFAGSGKRAETSFFVARMQDGQFAGPAGAFFLTYGTPTWKDEYTKQVNALKGKLLRLGKDNWTTLDNTTPIAFGNVTIPAGLWYLGITRDNAGAWSLVFLDPAKAKAAGAWPFASDNAPRAYEVKLTEAGEKGDVVETLTMTAAKTGKDQTKGKLTIAWGTFELTTSFQVKVAKPAGDVTPPAPPVKKTGK